MLLVRMKVREFFMKKRILSVFLALALCLSLSPTAALADGSTAMTPEGGSEHVNHCICGASHSSIGGHTAEAVITEWTAVSELSDITGTGNYYLAGDVTLNEKWTVANGTNITLCLNGHKLTSDNTSSSDTILIEGTLTITDCKTTGTITGTNTGSSGNHKVIVVSTLYDNCTLNLYAGTISGINAGDGAGGGVANCYNHSKDSYKGLAVFNFYGGTISGGTFTTI